MKIIFCKTAYLKRYDEDSNDTPAESSKYCARNYYAKEKSNFSESSEDGMYYGYLTAYNNEIDVGRIEGGTPTDDCAEDVLVIWTASRYGKNVIVGWYKNASVYRNCQTANILWNSGSREYREREYFIKAKNDDCYLLPEWKRRFEIPEASDENPDMGFGASSIWYADSAYAKEAFIPKVLKFIEKCEDENEFINLVFTKKRINNPFRHISAEWLVERAKTSSEDAAKALKDIEKYADINAELMMAKGDIFVILSDTNMAECCYEAAFKMDSTLDGICRRLMILYMETEQYEKAVSFAESIEHSGLYENHKALDKILLRIYVFLAHTALNDGKQEEALRKIGNINWSEADVLGQNMYYFDSKMF